MTSISDIRAKYPQYNDLSDQQVLEGFHRKFYSDMDFNDFASRIEGFQAAPQTNLLEQTMSGVNEGLAGMMGLPVDAVSGAINAMNMRPQIDSQMVMGADGIPQLQVNSIEQPEALIENPVGGGEWFRNALSPVISDTAPQNVAQRYGRRIGQEVGATAIPGGLMMRGATAPLSLATTEVASAVGSGLAGQTSREIAPDSAAGDVAASLVGGFAPIVAGRALRPGPQSPTMDDLRARQRAAYDAVDNSQAVLTPAQRQGLIDQMRNRTDGMDMDEFLHPRASRTMARMDSLEPSPRIADIEQKRRLIGRDVAGSIDPSESAIGQAMKDEIDAYLRSLADQNGLGPDAARTLEDLNDGRAMTQRIKKAEAVEAAVTKAERRAASSGTGGNAVNTTRQNIRAMLDNPKKSRGFSAAERAQMEAIVQGTPGVNFGRLLGRMSPSAGALPLMGNMAALAGGAAASPTAALLAAIPGTVGMGAKALAEMATERQIQQLLDTIRNGAPLASKGLNQTDVRAAIAAMLGQTSAAQPDN